MSRLYNRFCPCFHLRSNKVVKGWLKTKIRFHFKIYSNHIDVDVDNSKSNMERGPSIGSCIIASLLTYKVRLPLYEPLVYDFESVAFVRLAGYLMHFSVLDLPMVMVQ